jgi:hypothetical protein
MREYENWILEVPEYWKIGITHQSITPPFHYSKIPLLPTGAAGQETKEANSI